MDVKYEYLDHTADVLVHAWGSLLLDCVESGAQSIARYMYPLQSSRTVGTKKAGDDDDRDDRKDEDMTGGQTSNVVFIESTGATLHSLIYNLFTELLVLAGAQCAALVDVKMIVLDLCGMSATSAARLGDDLSRPNKEERASSSHRCVGEDGLGLMLYAKCRVTTVPAPCDVQSEVLTAAALGDKCHHHAMVLSKGTEVKAITKQGMRVYLSEEDDLWHMYFVLDI
jgi:SHS2 domain-containing protein